MHIIILALALFTNAQTGETVLAKAEVDSLHECAALLNDNREPKVVTGQGAHDGTWYMTDSYCNVEQY